MAGAKRDLTSGSVFGHIVRFVAPLSLGILAMQTTGLVDAYWLGKLGTAQLAAVAFVFPITFALFAVAIGLSSGAVAAVSRAVGAGDRAEVARLSTHAMLLGVVAVVIVTAIGLPLIDSLFGAVGAPPSLLPYVNEYMSVWFLGLIFLVGPVIANAILRALGDAALSSGLMILVAVVNLILDPILIFGWGPFPRLEVTGAALATVIANAVAFVLFAVVLVVREKLVGPGTFDRARLLADWRRIARVGAPATLSTGINPLMMFFVVGSVARFGEAAVAGFGVGSRVDMFATIPLFALSAAMAPLAGQNGGAGRLDRVRLCFRDGFLISAAWSLFAAAVLAIFAGPIAAAFVSDPAAQAVAKQYLWIAPISGWGYGVAMAASAGFNGLSRPLIALAITTGRSALLLFPLAWVGGLVTDAPWGAIVGLALANVITGIVVAALVLGRAYPPSLRVPEPTTLAPSAPSG